MDLRYFKMADKAKQVEDSHKGVKDFLIERLKEPGAVEAKVRKEVAAGIRTCAMDKAEELRQDINLEHRIRHPESSERVNSSRAALSLGSIGAVIMGRQFFQIVRG